MSYDVLFIKDSRSKEIKKLIQSKSETDFMEITFNHDNLLLLTLNYILDIQYILMYYESV